MVAFYTVIYKFGGGQMGSNDGLFRLILKRHPIALPIFCFFYFILLVVGVMLPIGVRVAMSFSDRIENIEHLNKVIEEERVSLGIPDSIIITTAAGPEVEKYLTMSGADASTDLDYKNKGKFLISFKLPTYRSIVKHELEHIHVATAFNLYEVNIVTRLFHEFLAYSYEIFNIDLVLVRS